MAVTNKSNKQVGCLSGVFFTTHYFCLEKRPNKQVGCLSGVFFTTHYFCLEKLLYLNMRLTTHFARSGHI